MPLYFSISRSLFSQSLIYLSLRIWLSTCEVLLWSWVQRSRVFRSIFWSIITLLHLARFWRTCLTIPAAESSPSTLPNSSDILGTLLHAEQFATASTAAPRYCSTTVSVPDQASYPSTQLQDYPRP